MTSPRFILMTSSAQVRGRAKQFGPYRRAAIVELEPGFEGCPAMISPRARGVLRIVEETGAMYAGGKTSRSAWVRTLAELESRVEALNARS